MQREQMPLLGVISRLRFLLSVASDPLGLISVMASCRSFYRMS
jgi:hypothetical protein